MRFQAPRHDRQDTRRRILEVLSASPGSMDRREIERAAYPLRDYRDLAVASAIGWLVSKGWIKKSIHSGRYTLTDTGLAVLALGDAMADGAA